MDRRLPIKVFSTMPQSREVDADRYVRRVEDVARWSDAAGCEGSLIYTDNSLVDPWLVAQIVLRITRELCPLIAVQPIYVHPYAAAKLVASFGYLHDRRVYLNLVAGGFVRDLLALDDDLEHDARYDRLVEYGTIIGALLRDDEPLTMAGRYYQVTNLRLAPRLPAGLFPGVTVSGSSPAGAAAARALGATAIQYPLAPSAYTPGPAGDEGARGIRIGIIARDDPAAAWCEAWNRFPPDRRGQLTHQLAMRTSDSQWHRQLSALVDDHVAGSPYWLHPFQNYKTFCPYLVGSYDGVAAELRRYLGLGFQTFILDIPTCPEDLDHAFIAFERASLALTR